MKNEGQLTGRKHVGAPTPEQQAVLRWMDTEHAPGVKCFVLGGYAGTGKTYLVGCLVERLRAVGRPFVLMAPTGRAAKVLSDRTGAPAHTIHKVIYAMDQLREYVQKDVDGSETFKFYFDLKNNGDDARTVYIVDEASMVSDRYSEGEFFRFGSGFLLKDLLKYVNFDHNDHGRKLIIVGDPAQLPPIGSTESPALDPEYLTSKYGVRTEMRELTDVVRHKGGSGILGNATILRDAIRQCRLNTIDIKADKPDVMFLEHDEVIERYVSLGPQRPPENAVIVAFSNRMVRDYNRDIRARYFPGANRPLPGDRLLVVANNHKGDVALMNGDLLTLVSAATVVESRTVTLRKKQGDRTVEIPVDLVFRDVEIEMEQGGQRRRFSTTILENLLDSGERDVSSDEQKALYIDFKIRHPHLRQGQALFKDALRADKYFNALRVKYGYAMTCHKAQGGEWSHVFVDFGRAGDIFNLDYFRWAYTALTRAKERLFAINPPHYDCLTLAGPVSPPADSLEIRDDLMVLDAEAVENEHAEASEQDIPFLNRIRMAVSRCLAGSAIAVEKVTSAQYCEHYTFRRAEQTAVLLLHYSSRDVVSRIMPRSGDENALTTEIMERLVVMQGKYIVVTRKDVTAASPRIEFRCEHEHMNEAVALLCQRASVDHVIVMNAKAVSRYHLACVFRKDGHSATVDYYFDGRGRLTRLVPRVPVTTSTSLLQQVLSYSARQPG